MAPSKQSPKPRSNSKPVNPPGGSRLRRRIRELLRGGTPYLRPVIPSVATAALTTLAFLLAPIKPYLYYKIWPEAPNLLILSGSQILEGQTSPVQVAIIPTPNATVGNGALVATAAGNSLRFRSGGTITIQTPRIEGTYVVSDTAQLAVIGIRPGVSEIKIELRTARGTYSTSKRIEVQQYRDAVRPLRDNFSGSWILQLGDDSGHISLQDDSSRISGTYQAGAERGGVTGWHDGTTLYLSLLRNPNTKWVFDTNFVEQSGYLFARGNAQLATIRGSSWVRVDQRPMVVTAKLALP